VSLKSKEVTQCLINQGEKKKRSLKKLEMVENKKTGGGACHRGEKRGKKGIISKKTRIEKLGKEIDRGSQTRGKKG